MAKKVCFITGASGRLGSSLARVLVEQGYEVRCLVMKKELMSSLPPGCIPFIGNLGDTHVLDSACRGADAVFHFAAIVGVHQKLTKDLIEVNVRGTQNLLEVCEKNKVEHFLYASTVGVYGRSRNDVLTEESRPRPDDKYGYSKMLAEEAIMESGVPYTIFRIAHIYGPGFETSFFKIFRAVKDGKAVIVGDGSNKLDLVYINDVVDAFLLATEDKESIGKIYNLSDGAVYTQEWLIDLAAELLKAKKPKRHVSELVVRLLARQRNLDSDELRFLTSNRVIDITKIKKELGFSPKVDIKAGGRALTKMFMEKYGY